MRLSGRVCKLEERLTAPGTGPNDEAEVELWASLWAGARLWPEVRKPENAPILEEDRVAAREFFAYCRSTGEKPTIAALNKWAHSESNG